MSLEFVGGIETVCQRMENKMLECYNYRYESNRKIAPIQSDHSVAPIKLDRPTAPGRLAALSSHPIGPSGCPQSAYHTSTNS